MSENDAQLELKKRARRRLVGAAALAVLAAIVLPMVMDQTPKQQPAQDIQIRIPAQDAGSFTSRILPVKPGSTPTPLPPTAAPEAKPAETVRQAAVPPAKAEAKADTRPEPKAEPKASQKPAEKPAAAKAEVSPAHTATRPAEVKAVEKKPEEAKAKPSPALSNGERGWSSSAPTATRRMSAIWRPNSSSRATIFIRKSCLRRTAAIGPE